MPICKYFLEGRCRFGANCWNEHPRGGGGGGGGGGREQQQSGAYSNNRGGWGNQFQKPQSRYIQPSTFSKSTTWVNPGRDVDRRGFGNTDAGKKAVANSGSFIQNRFTTLSNDNQECDQENILEIVRKDIEAWESTGQWLFSCYSVAKEYACVSGLVDISPEELRQEYYNSRAGGNLQHYVDSIAQLSNQHRNRMLELKKPNSSARVSMSAELRQPNQQKPSVGFGGMQTSTFGSSVSTGLTSTSINSNTFSFKPSAGLENVATVGFGNAIASSAPPPSGFGTKPVVSASVFGNRPEFGAPTGTTAPLPVFGSSATSSTPGVSVFGTSAPFGSSFTASSALGSSAVTGAPTASAFGSTVKATGNTFGNSATTTTSPNVFGAVVASVPQPQITPASNHSVSGSDVLYTPQPELSADDLREFEAKKFTLGRIPLRPPPIELLTA
ncbi:nucleoporin NUP42 [Amblyraja radiata]|uniref:nucleoporin NUP42 n=1 Tax=Amblyraja radiata TaxID=386614 RepID=UPI001401D7E9|nr:nucleoporin NUP42 [Amblyraja radiata]XP_032902241.1 nucleoporin NUP42 [Amblyraja radiata]